MAAPGVGILSLKGTDSNVNNKINSGRILQMKPAGTEDVVIGDGDSVGGEDNNEEPATS